MFPTRYFALRLSIYFGGEIIIILRSRNSVRLANSTCAISALSDTIKVGRDVESSRVKARRVSRLCVAVLVRLVRPCPPFALEQQKAVYVVRLGATKGRVRPTPSIILRSTPILINSTLESDLGFCFCRIDIAAGGNIHA